MTQAPPCIQIDDLGFAVAGRTILSGLNLSITEQRTGIVGQNGSGKTTLLRLLSGLATPTTGTVRICGVDPARDRKAVIGKVGLLFQNPDHQIIFPTVEEELAFGLRQMGQTDAAARLAARAVLTRYGRADWATASVQTLSQGQRHLLCLMAVLAMEPAVILLDEPFSGLDIPTQRQLTRELARLPQRLVTITHDPQMIAHYDRVIWLDEGRLRMDGAASPVLKAYTDHMEHLGGADADAHRTL